MNKLVAVFLFVFPYLLFAAGQEDSSEDAMMDDGMMEEEVREVNVYSLRQPFLLEPIIDAFKEESNIQVNVVSARGGSLSERLEAEGKYSAADVIMTVGIARLVDLADKGLLKSVHSEILEHAIPAELRDPQGRWFSVTQRARVIYSSKERVGKLPHDFSYLDLAAPEWKGRICTRSGKHNYNVALFAAMVAHYGESEARQWLAGVKNNLARKPQGNDRGQVQAIQQGVCDLSIGNSYYYGKMYENPEQKTWADAVEVNFPEGEFGTHVNISGAALAKYAPHPEEALKFLEFLMSDKAQKIYADMNYEFPVKEGVEWNDLMNSWGSFERDKLNLGKIAEDTGIALQLVDSVGYDF